MATVFRFASLPGELRNDIYERLCVDHAHYSTRQKSRKNGRLQNVDEPGMHLSIRNGPDTRLSGVSRRFRAEYAACVSTQAQWIFTDTNHPIPFSVSPTPTALPISRIHSAHFKLLTACNFCYTSSTHGHLRPDAEVSYDMLPCDVALDIRQHARLIQTSLRDHFQQVQHYTIQLVVYDMPSLTCSWPLVAGNVNLLRALEHFVTCQVPGKELRSIEIMIAQRSIGIDKAVQKFGDLQNLTGHGTWTKKTGWKAVEHPKLEEAASQHQGGTDDEIEDVTETAAHDLS